MLQFEQVSHFTIDYNIHSSNILNFKYCSQNSVPDIIPQDSLIAKRCFPLGCIRTFDQAFVSNRTGRLGKSCKPAWYQGKTGHKDKNRGVKNRFAELRVFYTLFLIWDIVKFGIRRASLSVIRGELWHLTVNKITRDISHNPWVMTSNGK